MIWDTSLEETRTSRLLDPSRLLDHKYLGVERGRYLEFEASESLLQTHVYGPSKTWDIVGAKIFGIEASDFYFKLMFSTTRSPLPCPLLPNDSKESPHPGFSVRRSTIWRHLP